MKRHGFKSISNSDKRLAHTVRRNLAYILFKNILDKVMRKAKNCKIPVTKRPNYIMESNLKFGFIFLKSSTLVSNYIAKLSTKVNPYYESIENFGITLLRISKNRSHFHNLTEHKAFNQGTFYKKRCQKHCVIFSLVKSFIMPNVF